MDAPPSSAALLTSRRKPELLAPAGDFDCVRAAVANGADAVYFGLQTGFNARARAATTLLLMGLDEPIRAGLAVALGDADKSVRLNVASVLFEVRGALRADDVAPGIEDRDPATKATFAMVLADLGFASNQVDAPARGLSFMRDGDASPHAGMFLTLDRVFPDGATEAMLGRIYRPRPGLPLTPITLADGVPWKPRPRKRAAVIATMFCRKAILPTPLLVVRT